MVYRGRLGKGCAECRAKKTRCDAARPSCGQCKRAGRQCSGYRDLDALRVVDQTSLVSQKSSRKTNSPTRATSSGTPLGSGYVGSSSSSPANSKSSQEDLLEKIVPGVRSFTSPHFWALQEASFLLFDQFISVASTCPKTELDFVALLYGDVPSHGMLASMVSALGFMALPSHQRAQSHQMFAREQYVSAVRETQKALQDPNRATSDETLATVLLLGLYEFVDAEEPQFNTSSRLSMHLEGSIKLLQLRGDAGMDHMSGTRMFHRICSQVVLGCMHRRLRIPEALLSFADSMHKHLHAEEMMALEVVKIAAQLCGILASTTVVEPSEAVDHFNTLLSLEHQLAAWEQRTSFRYHCRREPLRNSESAKRIPLRHQDTYFSHIAASCVNRYRSVRIVVNEEMIRLFEMVPTLITAAGVEGNRQCQVASITIAKMSEEIAYSLPFFFGEETCHLNVSEQDGIDSKPRAGMHAATVTLMPIYFSATQRVSPEMYRWLMRYLNWIGQSLGIGRANALRRERQLLEDLG
ncbi:hypothetical protein AC579_9265 [Pseudocercospora musae]|uniref:Zn(2)-C6 fungal-type domain-containing protein n=1 Tax=Pseudocercospora musae TaxID=113226 RepID=A0A139IHE5_9PEZI|nr:hypothetical protein AC579_9265 [Pseudocercospora musae]